MRKSAGDLGQRVLQMLSGYTSETNTQTYDRIYYYVKMRDVAGRFFSNHINVLQCYAPYLEPEIAAIGYHLPRMTRFFNRFHRAATTHYSAPAARVPTTGGGVSVSCESQSVAADLLKYTKDKLKRTGRKLGHKLIKRHPQIAGSATPELVTAVRQHPLTWAAFNKLTDSGILKPGLTLEHV